MNVTRYFLRNFCSLLKVTFRLNLKKNSPAAALLTIAMQGFLKRRMKSVKSRLIFLGLTILLYKIKSPKPVQSKSLLVQYGKRPEKSEKHGLKTKIREFEF